MQRDGLMLAVAGLLLCGALIAGCATTTTTNVTTAPTSATTGAGGGNQTSGTPSIMITSPVDGSTVSAGSVTVTAMVSNFNIVDKQGQASVSGEGHLHFYMDVSPLPSDPTKPAIPTDPNAAWAHVSGTTYTFTNVTPGQHTFAVQLANNDHTPVTPLATDSVTVMATGSAATTQQTSTSTTASMTTASPTTMSTTIATTTTTASSGGGYSGY